MKPFQSRRENDSVHSQADDSAVGAGIPTGSTVARDLDTTASSARREAALDKGTGELPESQTTSRRGPATISDLQNTTENAYGGGLYGADETPLRGQDCVKGRLTATESEKPRRASDSQSVDGGEGDFFARPVDAPPSSGDRDVDITGQSYIN